MIVAAVLLRLALFSSAERVLSCIELRAELGHFILVCMAGSIIDKVWHFPFISLRVLNIWHVCVCVCGCKWK